MELILALLAFAILIVAWLVLPGTAMAVEETPSWSASDSILAPVDA